MSDYNTNYKAITEERWEYMLEVLPPIYVTHLDGKPIKKGICCSEAYSHNDKGVILTICFLGDDGVYYEGFVNIYTADKSKIWDTYNHCYSKVIAETCVNERKPVV